MNQNKVSDVAIIGYSCRFPGGANCPSSYWRLLREGRDSVTEIPGDRWDLTRFSHPDPTEPGFAYSFAAGTLGDVSGFDAEFFGISPREAAQIDPQQRLLLELAWEALEHGGLVPSRLAGRKAAVFIGISSTDYANARQSDPSSGDAYFMLGSTLSIAANRVSFVFDLKGPSMAIDTACSSSLVALTEAWHAVRDGRVPMALVGGVNLLLSPYAFIGFSKASMLSPYGRCRAFDRLAEGYVRAEGGGMLVMKPLADALADGDPIRAVIRAADTNADGRTPGIAMPSAEMQAALLAGIYGDGGIDPADVAYFEAHGTGTRVGDPIETAAIGRAIGQRRDRPLPIGSAKSVIGHLEPASGMAGVIKALLVLEHREIPPTLHVDDPNPDIDFKGLNLTVAREVMALPETPGPAVIGVNSFGFGGANAHVALAAHAAPMEKPVLSVAGEEPAAPLLLSAQSETALKARATQMADFLDGCPAGWDDIAATAARRRSLLDRRVAVPGSAASAAAALSAFAEGRPGAAISGRALPEKARKVAFLFAGNGSQYAGMGQVLFAEDPVFRDRFTQIDASFRREAGWSLIDEMRAPPESSRLADTTVAQPMLFAVQTALVASLAAQGLVADAVLGHSIGEVAAAHCAGILDLDSAIRLIVARSAVQGETRGLGKMAGVMLDAERAAAAIVPYEGAIEIAAVNSSRAVTLTGEEAALRSLAAALKGVDVRILDLDYAFHSRILEPFEDDLARRLTGLSPHAGDKSFFSTVRGGCVEGASLDAAYWWDNLRQPVQLRDTLLAVLESGHGVIVEIGAHPILQAYIRHALGESAQPGVAQSVLTRNQPGADRLRAAALRAWTSGAALDLDRFFTSRPAPVDLPNYPWQHTSYWYPTTPEARGAILERGEGTLLGFRPVVDIPLWESVIDAKCHPLFAGHVVGGAVLMPATGFVEIALEASRHLFGDGAADLENVEIVRPLILDRARVVRTSWSPGESRLAVESRTRMSDEPWQVHMTARLCAPTEAPPSSSLALLSGDAVQASDHYAVAAALGLDYEGAFRSVRTVTVEGDQADAILGLDAAADGYRFHPALFDGGLQALFDILARADGVDKTAFLPQRIGRFLLYRDGVPARCRVRLTRRGARSLVADFILIDVEDKVLAEAHDFRFLRAELGRSRTHGLLHREVRTPLAALPGFDRIPETAFDAARGAITPAPLPVFTADLDRLAGDFARRALAALGHGPDSDMLDVALDAGVDADGVPFIAALLAMARQSGASEDVEASWRGLLARHPDALAEIGLTGLSGLRLTEWFSDGRISIPTLVEPLRAASPSVEPGLDRLAAAAASMAGMMPEDRRLRVFALDSGAGILARRLTDALPAGRCALTLAVADDRLAAGLREDVPEAEVVVFDAANPDPAFAARFDLIVATGMFTASPHPARTAEVLAGLGAPGAVLLAGDFAPAAWLDLVFGADPAWWRPREDGTWDAATPDAAAVAAAVAAGGWRRPDPVAAGGMTLLATVLDAETPALPAVDQVWTLVGDDRDRIRAIAVHLAARGCRTDMPEAFDAARPESWAALWRKGPEGVIWVPGLSSDPDGMETGDVLAAQQDAAWPLLAAAQGALTAEITSKPRLVTIVAGGFDPIAAPAWGVGRVLANEVPELVLSRIQGDDPERIAAEILAGDGEDEVALTPDGRLGVRVLPAALGTGVSGDATRLSFTPGSLDRLVWTPASRRAPKAGEVEIAVRATGLNFRDLMFALGLLPEEAVENGFAGATVGMEAAGEIVRVGAGVAEFVPGQRVLFFAPACFASHVTTRITAVAPLPDGLSFAEGATIPTVFFTIYYALGHLARLEAGERVLIHAAAGGVGMAAIQYARHVGAEIFATAGSPEKRDLVRLLGVPEDHIFDSRGTAFADDIRAATGGVGVDVVLNALAGEAIHKSLSVLRPFGRFIELGKRDFYADSAMGLRPFRNNLTYFGVDADQVIAERPDLARRLFREVVGLFVSGVFAPLPLRVWPAAEVVSAFRQMQAAKHVGKIVVAAPPPPAAVLDPAPSAPVFDADAVYLVTGGMGGFGLAAARWLAAQGVRHLALVSRRGAATPDADAILAGFAAQGVEARAYGCDVSDQTAVTTLIAAISAERPLKGVIHAAALFADTAAAAMTPDLLHASLAPKAGGAWALHRATCDLALDHFVVFSSVTTLFGNPGQANYVAANLFLEQLVAHRRALGLAGLAVCWGPIGDAGYLTRAADTAEILESRLGAASMTAADAFVWLGRLMADKDAPTLAVGDLDWRALRGLLPALRAPRFTAVAGGAESETGTAQDLAARLADISPEEALALITTVLAEAVAHVLRLPVESLDPHRPIYDFGMDSLMALELRMLIEEKTGIQLAAMAISPDVTLSRLAERVRDQLAGNTAASPRDEVARMLAAHAESAAGLDDALKAAEAQPGDRLIS